MITRAWICVELAVIAFYVYGDELTNLGFTSPFPYFGPTTIPTTSIFKIFRSPSHVHAYVARIFPKSIMISIQGDHYAILSFAVRRTALKNKMGLRSHFVKLVSRSEGPLFPKKIIAKYRINQALNGLIYALRAILMSIQGHQIAILSVAVRRTALKPKSGPSDPGLWLYRPSAGSHSFGMLNSLRSE